MRTRDEEPLPRPNRLDKPLREIYTAKAEKVSEPDKWTKILVKVFRDEEVIYEYGRNYSFLRTFEPFRQLQGDHWHDYAIISPQYSTFQILDLESGKVVAERPYPQRPWFKSDKYDEYERRRAEKPEWFEEGGYYAGKGPDDLISGEGFCPMELWVPDGASDLELNEDNWDKYSYLLREDKLYGNFGLVAGCIWGDDTSAKVRHIDLSRISEGVVTEDERFGYVELPYGFHLKDLDTDAVSSGSIQIPVGVRFNLQNGKASPWTHEEINWAKNKDEYWGKE